MLYPSRFRTKRPVSSLRLIGYAFIKPSLRMNGTPLLFRSAFPVKHSARSFGIFAAGSENRFRCASDDNRDRNGFFPCPAFTGTRATGFVLVMNTFGSLPDTYIRNSISILDVSFFRRVIRLMLFPARPVPLSASFDIIASLCSGTLVAASYSSVCPSAKGCALFLAFCRYHTERIFVSPTHHTV